jgi:hypothetical protein
MKCFKCNVEMESGYIESDREIFWSKIKHKQDIRISSKLFMVATVEALRCPNCEVIIIEKN